MFKNALVSVSDKTGLVEFLKPYVQQGLRIVSTGGTARHLRENNISVVDVSEQTGFPEVMDGRVKTLHPNIHMALLARDNHPEDRTTLDKYNIEMFDLVIGSLYPFEKVQQDNLDDKALLEFIDIGGPSFLRAAAKNFSRTTVVCSPEDYSWINDKQELNLEDKKRLAAKLYSHTASYDAMIAAELGADLSFKDYAFGGTFMGQLRYGENPQQQAAWFKTRGETQGLHQGQLLHGKTLSYNNLLDLDAALSTLLEFKDQPCCVSVKHNNPCGVAMGLEVGDVVLRSLRADPVSVFGGIIAINREVDARAAKHLKELFLECIVAPSFSAEALSLLQTKKNLRLLSWSEMNEYREVKKFRSILGGFLVQGPDQVSVWSKDWKVIGESPSEQIKLDLEMAWKVCAHLKSNAIALVSQGQTLGLGMGQVNRIDAVAQSIQRMKQFHNNLKTVVLASDAFFPFSDSIEKAAEAGIKWIIQPGGSMKDTEVIARAKELQVNLVLTGRRHFLH